MDTLSSEVRGKPNKRIRYVVLIPDNKTINCYGVFSKFKVADGWAKMHGGEVFPLLNMFESRTT